MILTFHSRDSAWLFLDEIGIKDLKITYNNKKFAQRIMWYVI